MRGQPEWERGYKSGPLFWAGMGEARRELTGPQREAIKHLGEVEEPERVKTLPYSPTYSVPLDCKHRAIYVAPSPEKGDIIYCRKCSDYRVVTGRSREVLHQES